jgi:hypothetical protein
MDACEVILKSSQGGVVASLEEVAHPQEFLIRTEAQSHDPDTSEGSHHQDLSDSEDHRRSSRLRA